jgi:ubiquitin carboxyl-terminal hydrolase 9/24
MELNEQNYLWAIQFLSKFHIEGQWRTKRLADWLITPKMNEKSATGYVGIKNLGCICYMNSFLQQMFMIPSFREAVFAV